ncbi:MAG: PQQ-dependent sugar dehydrogenase, partial [Melioribacteraceae bacterium]
GPDGFLYVAFGDGGSGGDPKNHGQNLKTILASIIRINIDSTSNNKNYSIPQDNPFVNNTDSLKEEIFAYGLRNVWRFSFDQTGNIWAADVGQNAWEEIHLIESGKNYGWRIMEGMHCFEPSTNCNREGLELPIWEYGHNSEGGYSITGGYVSQDINVPDILNKYIYADYVTGNIWAFDPSNSSTPNSLIKKVSQNISTFGIDENKTLYFADLTSGKIYKFIDNSVNSVGSITPSNFELLQNYPNPFNPSTNIKYTIPVETTHKLSLPVQLKIYDLLGKNIATLVEQNKTSGNYTIEFDASSLTSGIYFYRIIAGNFISTKKMILQK